MYWPVPPGSIAASSNEAAARPPAGQGAGTRETKRMGSIAAASGRRTLKLAGPSLLLAAPQAAADEQALLTPGRPVQPGDLQLGSMEGEGSQLRLHCLAHHQGHAGSEPEHQGDP